MQLILFSGALKRGSVRERFSSSPTGQGRISKVKVSCIACQDNAGKSHYDACTTLCTDLITGTLSSLGCIHQRVRLRHSS